MACDWPGIWPVSAGIPLLPGLGLQDSGDRRTHRDGFLGGLEVSYRLGKHRKKLSKLPGTSRALVKGYKAQSTSGNWGLDVRRPWEGFGCLVRKFSATSLSGVYGEGERGCLEGREGVSGWNRQASSISSAAFICGCRPRVSVGASVEVRVRTIAGGAAIVSWSPGTTVVVWSVVGKSLEVFPSCRHRRPVEILSSRQTEEGDERGVVRSEAWLDQERRSALTV